MKKLSTTDIADLFGGARALSRALGLDETAAQKWIDRGAAIPRWHHDNLLRKAKSRKINLVREQLVEEAIL